MTRARDVANIDGLLTAKGDIYAATAAATPARLAVGANGETLVADSSTSTGLRYTSLFGANKNAILNGDFRINQRNFTSATTDGSFGFDRWNLNQDGGTTYSAQTFTTGAAPVTGYEGTNYARLVTSGHSASINYAWLQQKIESVRTYAGQTVTISFWAQAGSGTPKIAVELDQQFGSGGSTRVTTYAGQVTLSTSWARYSVTVAVPSISGKTVGTSDFLGLELWVSAGSNFNSRTGSLGIQNGTFNIWGVQVEAGSVATAFQTATGTIQGELAACQRYYESFTNGGELNGFYIAVGYARNTTDTRSVYNYFVQKRVAPTVTLPAGTDFSIDFAATTSAATSASALRPSIKSFTASVSTTAVLTAGQAMTLRWNNSTTSLIEISAEL
jgi:hypothetical protein